MAGTCLSVLKQDPSRPHLCVVFAVSQAIRSFPVASDAPAAAPTATRHCAAGTTTQNRNRARSIFTIISYWFLRARRVLVSQRSSFEAGSSIATHIVSPYNLFARSFVLSQSVSSILLSVSSNLLLFSVLPFLSFSFFAARAVACGPGYSSVTPLSARTPAPTHTQPPPKTKHGGSTEKKERRKGKEEN